MTPLLAKIATFAVLIDSSTSHVDRLIRQGMPCVDRGRARRVDVERALAWLRERDAVANEATANDPAAEGRRAALRAIRAERKAG